MRSEVIAFNINKLRALMQAREIGTGKLAKLLRWKPDAVLKMIHSKQATAQMIAKIEIILDGKITGEDTISQETSEPYFTQSVTRILAKQRSISQLILGVEQHLISPLLLLKYEKEHPDPRLKLIAFLEKHLEKILTE